MINLRSTRHQLTFTVIQFLAPDSSDAAWIRYTRDGLVDVHVWEFVPLQTAVSDSFLVGVLSGAPPIYLSVVHRESRSIAHDSYSGIRYMYKGEKNGNHIKDVKEII